MVGRGEIKYDTYKRSTSLIKTRFNKIKKLVDELAAVTTPLSPLQVKALTSYSNELKKKKTDFELNLQRVLEHLDTDEAPESALAEDQDEISELFIQIISLIETLTPPEEPRTPSAESVHSVHFPTSASVRLPKLDLKSFDGNPLQWISFINLFDTTIHRNATLTNVAKFQYLLSALNGEPLSLVKSLSLTTANYLIAYSLLRERYHNARRLTTLHLNQILDLPHISCSSIKNMRHFVNIFFEHTEALKALDCDISTLPNPLLSAHILRKCDQDLRKKLEQYRTSQASDEEPLTPHSLPTVSDIIKFINIECTHVEDASLHNTPSTARSSPSLSGAHSSAHYKGVAPKKVHFASHKDVTMLSSSGDPQPNQMSFKPPTCFACNLSSHRIYGCPTFKDKSPQDRHRLVKLNNRCYSCLGNHSVKDCQSKASCNTCHRRHHSLLHFHNQSGSVDNVQPHCSSSLKNITSPSQMAPVSLVVQAPPPSCAPYTTVLLATTLVKLTTSSGHSHVFRALLDSGSMSDFISERAAQLLGSPRQRSNLIVMGLSHNQSQTRGMLHLSLDTLAGHKVALQHPFNILEKISVDLPRVPISPSMCHQLKDYTLADPTFHLPGRIDVLLGSSIFSKILTHENHSLGPNMPHVLGTIFGHVLMGTAPCDELSLSTVNHTVTLHSSTDADLHTSLQKFWHMEEPPQCSMKTSEELQCDNFFDSTHTRDDEGRYIVKLPFKGNHPPLGSSRVIAERRFLSLENKLKCNPDFKRLYLQFMAEYLSQGHMTRHISFDPSLPHYFLPHHGVLKETSSTTKLRTVFDASCKTSTGVSLNDILLTGPKLQTDICDILLQFRSHRFVFSCDIRQMYRQIVVHPDDQNFQLILWRPDPHQPLDVYKLTTVTYGLNSSPYLAIRTLRQLAEDEGAAYPRAAEVLRNQSYVDDILSGSDSEEDAVKLQTQLVSLLQRGGFELRKWISNSPKLLQGLPPNHLETPGFLHNSSQPHFSILGLHWSPATDTFSYQLDLPSSACTKRQVLSSIARIYDPCGFLAPITMWCKCFMQILWTQQIGWDEPISNDLADKWHMFIAELQATSDINIPRALHFSEAHSIEIHGFSDASERGYAAVVYLRCSAPNNSVIVRQVIAKTRVAPLKRITLPRLELCAAHLLAQLVAYCLSIFKEKCQVSSHYLWCDSSVALTWLQTPPFLLKTYVANRVAQTQDLIPSHWWHHISGNDNPADCASRGILPSQLPSHPLWYAGPSWLQLPHNEWPKSKFTPIELDSSMESKSQPLTVLTTVDSHEWDLLTRFSSWDKLVRVTAYLLRFVDNSRSVTHTQGPLTLIELKKATLTIVKLVQQTHFSEDFLLLKRQKLCSSKLRRLTPFIDSHGLIRVGGRLNRAPLNYASKHPLLLPKTHHVVNLIISHHHVKHLHAGPQLTQALISQKFWILSARSVIRSNIFRCLTCFRQKPKNRTPLMGELPSSRLMPARPFLHTGIDYGGPFNTKVHNLRGLRTIKTYLCLFVCMVTKAVHLEVVTDLTTGAFIAALTRFVSRRGLCADIYSDCGTNFVGANTLLTHLVNDAVKTPQARSDISEFALKNSINFHFNPPASPNFGGLWESAIKSAKYHLHRVIGEHLLTLSEFMTLTTQVEAMLNSRPLTPLSADPAELAALTPGHFLIGTPLVAVPEPELQDQADNRLRHWQLIQAFHQRIWKRWQAEYLHTLQQRGKWTTPSPELQVGDLVLLHDSSPPLHWPLGRITDTHPGADGVVRVVDVRTTQGLYRRPASKVFALPSN